MRYIFASLILWTTTGIPGFSQSNTFPASGNAGIGTVSPYQKLEVAGNIRINSQNTGTGGLVDRIEFSKCHQYGCNASIYELGSIRSYSANGYAGGLQIYTSRHIGNGNYSSDFVMTIGATSSNISSQNVGIGAANPYARLEVLDGAGEAIPALGSPGGKLALENGTYGTLFGVQPNGDGWIQQQRTDATAVAYNLLLNPSGGNVGIGTNSPAERLSVNGNIRSKKIVVSQTGWPDYVFSPNYSVPSLDSVSNFISMNGRLPGFESAEQVETKGLDVGEMEKKLLRQLEEVVLYVIDLKKQVESSHKEIALLKEKVAALSEKPGK